MKLEEWKRFLETIPDSDYTREIDYTEFCECETVDAEKDEDARRCFVTLNEKQVIVKRANVKKGFVEVFKKDMFGNYVQGETGVIIEQILGDVKIVKYKDTL